MTTVFHRVSGGFARRAKTEYESMLGLAHEGVEVAIIEAIGSGCAIFTRYIKHQEGKPKTG